jgi:hypothetical protein
MAMKLFTLQKISFLKPYIFCISEKNEQQIKDMRGMKFLFCSRSEAIFFIYLLKKRGIAVEESEE